MITQKIIIVVVALLLGGILGYYLNKFGERYFEKSQKSEDNDD